MRYGLCLGNSRGKYTPLERYQNYDENTIIGIVTFIMNMQSSKEMEQILKPMLSIHEKMPFLDLKIGLLDSNLEDDELPLDNFTTFLIDYITDYYFHHLSNLGMQNKIRYYLLPSSKDKFAKDIINANHNTYKSVMPILKGLIYDYIVTNGGNVSSERLRKLYILALEHEEIDLNKKNFQLKLFLQVILPTKGEVIHEYIKEEDIKLEIKHIDTLLADDLTEEERCVLMDRKASLENKLYNIPISHDEELRRIRKKKTVRKDELRRMQDEENESTED